MSTALAVHHGPFGRVTLYNLDRSMALHAHREGHLIFHVQGPEASIRIDDDIYPMFGRQAVAISPWQLHNYMSLDPGQPSLFLTLYIKPFWFLEASRQPNASLRFGRNQIEVTEPIARLVYLLASGMLEDADDSFIAGYLCELTQACFDQSWQWVADGATFTRCAPPVRDFRVRNSVKLMQNRVSERIVLDNIARDSGLSRPHFYKLFRQQIGITPNIYLNTLRMETAIDRLTTTHDPVTDIGLDLGFSSQASFTRFFIANVGIAPSDYRRVVHFTGTA
ncbi:AraC family transcriptional regulator [Aquamicrobium sp. LC103]|uniref:helix-turn-helix transcriptional regulator n=1 Tax=Aquamicrobium sp. LC103 TaxID=1120658 RepID=UPI00063EA1B5|nr:AraC family transcriptional regulator [Aquamicrobium sp. LC103]TKT76226.1 helix-turn-helix transcriptional regulator [Aquamicrobium sp. LC103]